MEISKEDRELIRKFEAIRQKGFYVSGQEVTDLYNRVLNKHVNSTNCGSCISQRIREVVEALNHQEAVEAKQKEEENKAKMAKVREAKKKKEEE